MRNPVFTGAATAIVTPMNEKGVDYQAFEKLIEWQIANGIDAIVAAGTSGEGSTLSDEEHKEVLSFCVKTVAGRVPVIAGTGSNDTAYAIQLTQYAEQAGCDAMLLVTPYYNKATQNGLYESFAAIAAKTDKPCILYNVPSRTGCNLLPQTVARLAEIDNIVALKDASGNIAQTAKTISLCPDDFAVYSGNDDQIVPILSLGGKGVISVLSNIMPAQTHEMCRLWFEGKVNESAAMQIKYFELIEVLFCEVNPIPVKAACAAMGFGSDFVRLPLTVMEDKNKETLYRLMKEQGLI